MYNKSQLSDLTMRTFIYLNIYTGTDIYSKP